MVPWKLIPWICGYIAAIFISNRLTLVHGLHNTNMTYTNDSCNIHRVKTIHPYMMNQCVVKDRSQKECLPLKNYGVVEIQCKDVINVVMSRVYSNDILIAAIGKKGIVILAFLPLFTNL